MKYILVPLLFCIISMQSFADIVCNDSFVNYEAVYELQSFTCNNGYFLPANATACTICQSEFSCSGGEFDFNPNKIQGLDFESVAVAQVNNACASNFPNNFYAEYEPNSHTCSSGYYLPANVDECTICPANSYCVGGTYSFNETTDQGIQSCVNGFSPSGSAVCYPHILHVGDSNVYLHSTKQTTPSLNIKIGNDVFYANMITERTKMNKDSSHYLHVKTADNIHYYVCDDTTCPQ